MRRNLLFLTLLFSYCISNAQTHWNEWINFSQKYYKIPVSKNGIYRIDSTALANAGINLSTIDPRNIQLFFRGKEQYIYLQGEADGKFNSSDYIEFYGQKNDGTLDSILYKGDLYNKPVRQPNPYYSLFNDTAAYFLTWNASNTNNRIKLISDTTFSSYTQTQFFLKKELLVNNSKYYYGYTSSANITFPGYDEAEGWSGPDFYQGQSYTSTLNTSNVFTSGPAAHLQFAIMGESESSTLGDDHILTVKYKDISGNNADLGTISFHGYALYNASYTIPASLLGNSTNIQLSALTGSFPTSRNTVPYITIKYPHTTDLENKSYFELYVPENFSQNKSYYSFSNLNNLNSEAYMYDLTNHTRIPLKKNGNTLQALISNSLSSSENFCVVKSENQFLPIIKVKPVNGTGLFTNFQSLAADSAYLIITNKKLMVGSIAYQNYRAGAPGGSHTVVLASIEELYDQFGYGISKNPLTIRHFVDFCITNFPSLPHHLLLIGKSIQNDLCRNSAIDPGGINYASSLVPSIGYPTSDNMLVAGLNNSKLAPAIPIGRIPANTNTEVLQYLTKVNEYEHPPLPNPDEWMKHIIHLSGGANASQQVIFASFLANYENIIKDPYFGGYVHKFGKNSSSSTQTSYTDSIKQLMSDGVSLLTFFGHSGATVFDFNILPPDQYTNSNGKYPFMIADGCVAGDIHQPLVNGVSSSELYTLSPKGMIGFFASSGLGTVSELNYLTQVLYSNIGHKLYGKTIGKCIQASMDSVDGNGSNPYVNAICLNMTLSGDPAIVIHCNKLPDYAVNTTSVFFTPADISTNLDSFTVNIIVTNLGKAIHDSVKTEIKRIFPDGTYSICFKTIPHVFFKDTLKLRLPLDPIKGPGLNKFEVQVNPDHTVQELDYSNNNLISINSVPLLITSGDVVPVYPIKYAIIPKDTVTLKAYTINPFTHAARYIFEIDTTDRFNSPQKRTQYATQAGAVINALSNNWSPTSLIFSDSTVYYWRVKRDTADLTYSHWKESSFQYIKGKHGWGQSHYFQFLKGDNFSYIDTNRTTRTFGFVKQNHSIEVGTINYSKIKQANSIYFFFDASKEYAFSWISAIFNPAPPHVVVCVINPNTGGLWHNNSGLYGSYNTGGPSGSGDEGFEFYTATAKQQDTLAYFLKNVVPCGHKIIVFTPNNHNLGDLLNPNSPLVNQKLVSAFQSAGWGKFTLLKNDFPYIAIGRKCGTGMEYIADSVTQTIFLGDTCAIRRSSGAIYSETIGPASQWNSFHWKYISSGHKADSLAKKDTVKITILGITNNGKIDTLKRNISKDSLNVYNLNTFIDAKTYPYLQLQANINDKALRTAAQLRKWQLLYDGILDASLNPIKYFSFYNSTIQQGDSIKVALAIENISGYSMDSLWIDWWVYDANRKKIPIKSMKMDSLRINKFVVSKITFSTKNFPAGASSLWIEANPYNNFHQLEQYHFNNIGNIPFTVNADHTNPLLDITFDGIHIMNGDIVSAKPLVTIQLKDENKFLVLNDTSAFEIYLKSPSQNIYQRLHFGDEMGFEPATLPNNSCKITYSPALDDGVYELKAQAKDRSGNSSGKSEYNISFEVVNKPSITNVLNYPNPFSTATRFMFTLTGSVAPDYFKIQIMTISGKVVKEIDKYELGAIHIGRNITDYVWNGKDDFGDQLANGIYLYRVQTQLDGKSLEHRDSKADPFFNKGYGKMYLIR